MGYTTNKMHQIRFRPGLCLEVGPRWGTHDAPSKPLVGWGVDAPCLSPPPRVNAYAWSLSCRLWPLHLSPRLMLHTSASYIHVALKFSLLT